jgi:hypothetical protein
MTNKKQIVNKIRNFSLYRIKIFVYSGIIFSIIGIISNLIIFKELLFDYIFFIVVLIAILGEIHRKV